MVQLTLLYAVLSLLLYSSTATPRTNGTEINLPVPRHGISGWRLSLQRPYQVSENTPCVSETTVFVWAFLWNWLIFLLRSGSLGIAVSRP